MVIGPGLVNIILFANWLNMLDYGVSVLIRR